MQTLVLLVLQVFPHGQDPKIFDVSQQVEFQADLQEFQADSLMHNPRNCIQTFKNA
jgi:hypothetical protein